eukprot:TRINITY_DN1239_c0_g1_i1.p1 TRINITY_DN1239_c0_g1~~TRINITY_DN1239_c0_g1_i1.p1  ORF type:complete len:499 (-),score=88.04 TRINITY_DN1239_c0_g1_i1:113-1609(-)
MQHSIPLGVLTDSYKAGHFEQYPEAKKMVCYGEFRGPFEKDKTDSRFVWFGIRYIVQTYLERKWTKDDVENAEKFYQTHNAGFKKFPFPKDLFMKFVTENDGWFPIKLETLPEGTCANVRVPVYQITADGEYSRLCTFFETVLTQVWYPTCVATLSRRTKDLIEASFKKTVDDELQWLLESRLHDFGFRGTTCVEQSILGGSAHLLNFGGSDTMPACYYVQYHLNNGKPIGTSIPATEHSVMTSWATETAAIKNMIDKYGGTGGIYACVLDSYDYKNALTKIIPDIAHYKSDKGSSILVMRPDSGDPVECVMDALKAGEAVGGVTLNKKGYKVVNGFNVIQGDGINIHTVEQIIKAFEKEKFSAQNVAYGMGGGLLQRVNRDTMSFATKLNFIRYADGKDRDIMKKPLTDPTKISYPGILQVKLVDGKPTVFPRGPEDHVDPKQNLLKVVYDKKKLDGVWDDFETVRKRIQDQWHKIPKVYDPISAKLHSKIKNWSNK